MKDSPSSVDMEELHTVSTRISEVILGGQDGIVNVLGVVLGVAAASGDSRIIIMCGVR